MATVRESLWWFNYCRTMTAPTELHHPAISDVAITDVLFVRLVQSLFETVNDSLSRTRDAVTRHRSDRG